MNATARSEVAEQTESSDIGRMLRQSATHGRLRIP
jgi:hypothetical protein